MSRGATGQVVDMGLPETASEGALSSAVRSCYSLLQLITFFTTGEQESRAWRLRKGGDAMAAASVIHTDIGKNLVPPSSVVPAAAAAAAAAGGGGFARRAGLI